MSVRRCFWRTVVAVLMVCIIAFVTHPAVANAELYVRVKDNGKETLYLLAGKRVEMSDVGCAREKSASISSRPELLESDPRYPGIIEALRNRYFDCNCPIEGFAEHESDPLPDGPPVSEVRVSLDWENVLVVSTKRIPLGAGPYGMVGGTPFDSPCPASVRSMSAYEGTRSIAMVAEEVESVYFYTPMRTRRSWALDYSGDYLLYYYKDTRESALPRIIRFPNKIRATFGEDGKIYILSIDEHYHWYNPADFLMILSGHPPMKADVDLIVYDPIADTLDEEEIADDLDNGTAYFMNCTDQAHIRSGDLNRQYRAPTRIP